MSTITIATPIAGDAAAPNARRLHRRLHRRLLPLYVATFFQGVNLWVPVEKLFMDEIGFDPASVGLMAAAYAAVVPLLEVPSGILADRWSRRGVLTMATAALFVSNLIGAVSDSVTVYIVGAMFLGVYFAMQSGTLDSVVYDTVLDETGGSEGFEQRIGRVRMIESAALVSSALAGGWIASVTSTRFTYFLTLPFLVVSVVALLAFREPRLHKAAEPTSVRSHISTTYRTIVQRDCLLPIITLMVLTSLLLTVLFEFGPLWLVAVAAPAYLYGPHFAGLASALGLAGLLAGRLRLADPAGMAGVVAVMVASTLVLVTVQNAVIVTIAQVVIAMLSITLGILLTAKLHDAVPSNIRSGVASGVGTFTWFAFLPFGLVFGQVSKHAGVHAAGWMITAVTVLAGVLLIRLALHSRAEVITASAASDPEPSCVGLVATPAPAPAPTPTPAAA